MSKSDTSSNDAQKAPDQAPTGAPPPPRRMTWLGFGNPFQSAGDQKDNDPNLSNLKASASTNTTGMSLKLSASASPSYSSGIPVPSHPFTVTGAGSLDRRPVTARGQRPSGDHRSNTEVKVKPTAFSLNNDKELQLSTDTNTATDANNNLLPRESEPASEAEPAPGRRMGHPNVYRKDSDVLCSIPSVRYRPSTALPLPFVNEYEQASTSPSAPSSGDTVKTKTVVTPSKTQQHQHPFRTAGFHSRFAQQQTRAKSPMDPAFRFLSPYMIGQNWSARTATTFMVSRNQTKISILKTCGQLQPVPIHVIFDNLRKIAKIGEGVFGEVYTGHFVDGHCGPATGSVPRPRVYKVVPIEGDKRVNQEQQKLYGEIEPEIVVSRRLNVLLDENQPNFTEGFAKLSGALVCRGAYPRVLSLAWKKYQKEQGSENDLPEFKDNQEYVVLESDLYGHDVESYTFVNAKQALSLLVQVAHTLGVGEAGVKFEHRDLHWGNILVMDTPKSHIRFTLNGEPLLVRSCGIKSTIIDFTIASTENDDGRYIYTDLSQDEDQFNGDEDYQFEIYRMMRKELQNDWSRFAPRNNIFWMHYLADKLIRRGHYADRKSDVHRKYMARLRYFKSVIREYESCAQFALTYPEESLLHIDSADD